MKTWKKIFLCILALIVIAGIVCVTMFVTNKNRIKEYSTYCMDEVRNQLWEYLENVSNFYEWKNNENNWYLYSGKVSYEWVNYDYYCRVSGKDNAEVVLMNFDKDSYPRTIEDLYWEYTLVWFNKEVTDIPATLTISEDLIWAKFCNNMWSDDYSIEWNTIHVRNMAQNEMLCDSEKLMELEDKFDLSDAKISLVERSLRFTTSNWDIYDFFKIKNNENEEDFVSYYDNWAIREKWAYIDWKKEWIWTTYDEEWNVIEMKEYKDWELVEGDLETYNDTNILSVDENNILNTDELKKICEEWLKDISDNPNVTRTDEKLFINTYWFKWIYKGGWMHDNSPTFCNIHVNWQVFTEWFFLDNWQSMDEIHSEMSYGNPWWIWEKYPNIKEFYWFIWNIVLWDMIQTTYLTWKNIMYYDPYRWIAFKLWAEFDWGLIREIDTDENGIPHSEIILLVKWDENEENRTWINGFREVYTISVVSKTNLKNFNANPDLANAIWENNEYYFDWYGVDTNIHFSDLQIFDVEKMTY